MTYEEAFEKWPPFMMGMAKMAMKGGSGRGRRTRPFDDMERMAAVKHFRGGPHFGGPFGPPFGGPPFGGGRGRRRRGDVRVALLLLLAEEARNGYQLMQIIEERSGGRWRPSPGSVYPTLSQLEDEGLIHATERDGTKLFEITDQGREYIEEHGPGTAPWEDEDDPGAPALSEIASLVIQIGRAGWQVVQDGDEGQIEQARQTLAETRRALYRILAEETDA
jgi:DNA-binding PadR family transcriptional regulator